MLCTYIYTFKNDVKFFFFAKEKLLKECKVQKLHKKEFVTVFSLCCFR